MISDIIQFASFVVMTALAFSWRKTALKAEDEVRRLNSSEFWSDQIIDLEWRVAELTRLSDRAMTDLETSKRDCAVWAQKWEEEWQKNHSKK